MIRVGVVPANKVLFAKTVPANNLFLIKNHNKVSENQGGRRYGGGVNHFGTIPIIFKDGFP